MSQHDFNIANQSFPATRTDLNNALVALASNSSGDAEPATKYANQWWYETDTNTLKLRNEANDAWISIAVLDQSGNAVQSITTAGLTLGSTAISATGTEINQLDAITRGSIVYGNASGATARLSKGGAGTVLTSDGTDISWAAAAGGGTEHISTQTASSGASYLTFTNYLSSSYSNYILSFDLLKNNGSGGNFHTVVQLSTDGGSNWLTATSAYTSPDNDAYYGLRVDGGYAAEGGGANSQGVSGFVYIYSLGAAANTTSYSVVVTPQYGNTFSRRAQSGYGLNARTQSSASAHNAIRIAVNGVSGTSTFISGKVSLLGVKNS